MRRVTAVMGVAVAVLFTASLYAQSKVNFTGKWSPDADKNAAAATAGGGGGGGARGGGGRGGGPTITNITQDATTIKIERLGADGTAMGAASVYKLDGSDSKNMMPGRGGAEGTEVVSNAKWDGDSLVITANSANGPTTTTYSMDGADLKIVTLAPGRGGAAATPRTQWYKKG